MGKLRAGIIDVVAGRIVGGGPFKHKIDVVYRAPTGGVCGYYEFFIDECDECSVAELSLIDGELNFYDALGLDCDFSCWLDRGDVDGFVRDCIGYLRGIEF